MSILTNNEGELKVKYLRFTLWILSNLVSWLSLSPAIIRKFLIYWISRCHHWNQTTNFSWKQLLANFSFLLSEIMKQMDAGAFSWGWNNHGLSCFFLLCCSAFLQQCLVSLCLKTHGLSFCLFSSLHLLLTCSQFPREMYVPYKLHVHLHHLQDSPPVWSADLSVPKVNIYFWLLLVTRNCFSVCVYTTA